MACWVRFRNKADGTAGFGTLEGDGITLYSGDMFAQPVATGATAALAEVELLTPCTPSKLVALWNNYRALAEKLQQAIPPEPLYFLKAPSSYLAHGGAIRRPPGYEGKVVYEGELGIVIGRRLKAATAEEAAAGIFGYTCINDVTALDTLGKDASFAQWTRAKGHDTFGVFGPGIGTGLDPQALVVKTLVGGRERQNYPCADMIFAPADIVRLVSQDMTLEPGDVIACGTSLGVLPMRPGHEVSVVIDGIGTLTNTFEPEDKKEGTA